MTENLSPDRLKFLRDLATQHPGNVSLTGETVLVLLDRIKYLEGQTRRNYQDWQIAYGRAEAAEAAVQRVRDAIKDAPTSDPTSGRTGPPDDWPDDGELIGQGEFLVAEQVRRALDGGEQK